MVPKPLLDMIIVEDGQCDGCLADSTNTYQGNGFEVFGETGNLFDKVVGSSVVRERVHRVR